MPKSANTHPPFTRVGVGVVVVVALGLRVDAQVAVWATVLKHEPCDAMHANI